jgi:DNA polymerase elongation subunit (family B)
MHDWVVSFDLNSLYPHLIMQYNISPETKDTNPIWKRNLVSPDSILSRNRGEVVKTFIDPAEYFNDAKTNNLSVAANGVAFRKDRHGFLPELMETMYEERKRYKKMMIESKKNIELLEEEISKRKLDR